MAKVLSVNSPVAVITTGTVPTTSTLKKGELAYGTIGGKVRYFGNTGSTIIELTPKEYTALANGGITVDTSGQISISEGGVAEAMLASALQTKINNVLLKNNTTSFSPSGNYNPATKKYVDDAFGNAMSVAHGQCKALVFDTKNDLDEWLEGSATHPSEYVASDLNIGDVLFIRDLDVPDYWWDGMAVQTLESDIDLSNYYNKTETEELIDSKIDGISVSLVTREI
jgi:hypothetical protein